MNIKVTQTNKHKAHAMKKKTINISIENHDMISELAKKETRTREAQLNVILDKIRARRNAK